MNNRELGKNNKGASLVLVIVALLFVGLISSIILTITVGNSRTASTNIASSGNFYSSEGVLDDLKMFLKKYATEAATEAYAMTLEGADVDINDTVTGKTLTTTQDKFNYNFRQILASKLGTVLGVAATDDGSGKHFFDSDFLQYNVTFDRDRRDSYGNLSEDILNDIQISYDSFSINPETGFIELDGVVVSFERKSDHYKSVITTDIVFNVAMPGAGGGSEGSEFTYGIDHYIIIAKDNVEPKKVTVTDTNGLMSGLLKGNIYAGKDIEIRTEDSKVLELDGQYIIAKNNFNVLNGNLKLAPITTGSKNLIQKTNESCEAEIWCQNLKVQDANVYMLNHLKDDYDNTVNTRIYLSRNLELNGEAASFEAKSGETDEDAKKLGGQIICYTDPVQDSDTIFSKTAPASSAVILNGLGAKLKLSTLINLEVAGVAYTGLSSLGGVKKFVNGQEDYSDFTYYTQGESVTYRTIQPLYLIPGEEIKSVGHNPMTVKEYEDSVKGKIETVIPKAKELKTKGIVTDSYIATSYVRYIGNVQVDASDNPVFTEVSEKERTYVYLFWDFASVNKAVDYFNTAKADRSAFYAKQAGVLGVNSGCIELPEAANCNLKGYALEYKYNSEGKGVISARQKTSASTFTSHQTEYDNLCATLKESVSDADGINKTKTAVENMFPSGVDDVLASGVVIKPLTGPLDTLAISGSTDSIKYKESSSKEYILITSNQPRTKAVTDPEDSTKTIYVPETFVLSDTFMTNNITKKGIFGNDYLDYTYIIIANGDVDITFTNTSAKPFKCLLISEGSVMIPNGLYMECLGMVSRTEVDKDNNEKPTERISEFFGMLNIDYFDGVKEEKATEKQKGTRYLRTIFGVLGKKFSVEGGNGDDFVTVNLKNWKRN